MDVIFGDEQWLKDALAQPKRDPVGYPVIGLPYLILLKMGAQRAQDWADISRMLGLASDDAIGRGARSSGAVYSKR